MPSACLRYWKCQGRAEPLRLLLEDLHVDYEEESIAVDAEGAKEWEAKQTMSSYSGPFGSLPVLEWPGDRDLLTVPQTLSIAQFVALSADGSRWRDHPPPPLELTRVMTLGCCLHEDVCQVIIKAIFNPNLAPRLLGKQVPQQLERLEALLLREEDRLEEQEDPSLGGGGAFLTGAEPVWADYFLFHAVQLMQALLGPPIMRPFPALRRMYSRMAERPRIAAYLASDRHLTRITGSAKEEEHRAALMEMLS